MYVHFIAIGGSVMHQLAIALKRKGYRVSGSDDEIFEPARSNLEKEGILPPSLGWDPERVSPDLDAIILGMHAREDNPELQKARDLGLTIYSFPEYIYQESRNKIRLVVGGSHGKTTTTAMIMHVLQACGRSFDYMVGARLEGFSQSVNITDAPVIVCEGDEYPASALNRKPKFHFLFPHIAILTGIAWDHINVFPTFDNYLEQFRLFIDKIEPGGILIYNHTDPVLNELVKSHAPSIRRQEYGLPDFRIEDGSTFIRIEGTEQKLAVFGDHNLLNLQAAWLAVKQLGIESGQFLGAIGSFTGASKRLELLGKNKSTKVFRDFAHAPSKVKATMEAVRQQFPDKRLIAVLELHTFSSLNEVFMEEYRGSMDAADEAVVFYSKHALELKRMPELSVSKVIEGFDSPGLIVINKKEDLEDFLDKQNYDDTNLLLMSSGNYDGLDIVTFTNRIAAEN